MLPRPFSTFQVLSAVVAVAPAANPVEWPLSVGKQNKLNGQTELPRWATRTSSMGNLHTLIGRTEQTYVQPEQPQRQALSLPTSLFCCWNCFQQILALHKQKGHLRHAQACCDGVPNAGPHQVQDPI
ncbi:MAG: hypothetical protein FRX49_02630 [Trebouxia sp. A1-2]|nr:MAG: hypothetical protein FRX49_02630 [Trebouxia sp. A1-2]